jgi:hypothetical protein
MGVYSAGVYFTNGDIIELGKKLGYKYDYKSREYLIKTLFTDAENDKKETELLKEINEIIIRRVNEYKNLGEKYPNAKMKISEMFQKARATQMLLQREIQNSAYRNQG